MTKSFCGLCQNCDLLLTTSNLQTSQYLYSIIVFIYLPLCYFTGCGEVCEGDDGLVGDRRFSQRPRHDGQTRLATAHRSMATGRGQHLWLEQKNILISTHNNTHRTTIFSGNDDSKWHRTLTYTHYMPITCKERKW